MVCGGITALDDNNLFTHSDDCYKLDIENNEFIFDTKLPEWRIYSGMHYSGYGLGIFYSGGYPLGNVMMMALQIISKISILIYYK